MSTRRNVASSSRAHHSLLSRFQFPSLLLFFFICCCQTCQVSATPSSTSSSTSSASSSPLSSYSTAPSASSSLSSTGSCSQTRSTTPTTSSVSSPSMTSSGTPTPSVTPTMTTSSSITPTITKTPSPTPSLSVGASPSATCSPSPSTTITPTSSATPSVTPTPSPTPSISIGASPSTTETATRTATSSRSRTPSATKSRTSSMTSSLSVGASPSSSYSSSISTTSSPAPYHPMDASIKFIIDVLPLSKNITFFEPVEFMEWAITLSLRKDVSKLINVGLSRVAVTLVIDRSLNLVQPVSFESQLDVDLRQRRQLQNEERSGVFESRRDIDLRQRRQLQNEEQSGGVSIEVAVGLGSNPEKKALALFINKTVTTFGNVLENRSLIFLPSFTDALINNSTSRLPRDVFILSVDLSSLVYVPSTTPAVIYDEASLIIYGSSISGGLCAILLLGLIYNHIQKLKMIQEMQLRTISPRIISENPLRLRRTREKEKYFEAEKKRRIFLPLPTQSFQGGSNGIVTQDFLHVDLRQGIECVDSLRENSSSLASSAAAFTLRSPEQQHLQNLDTLSESLIEPLSETRETATLPRKENAFGRLTRALKERQKAEGVLHY